VILSPFQQQVDKEKFQVFLFVCPGNMPFSFAVHPWFVVNKQGVISRWEVLFTDVPTKTNWGHLYLNRFPPFQGIEVIHFSQKYFWKAKLFAKIEGQEAKQMADFIENSQTLYPFRDTYALRGPNSNTYAQWILNKFPEMKVELPWNSFGKSYHKK